MGRLKNSQTDQRLERILIWGEDGADLTPRVVGDKYHQAEDMYIEIDPLTINFLSMADRLFAFAPRLVSCSFF